MTGQKPEQVEPPRLEGGSVAPGGEPTDATGSTVGEPCDECGHGESLHDFDHIEDHDGCHPCTVAGCSCPCWFPSLDDGDV